MRHKLEQAAKMLSGEEGGKRDCAWYQRTLKESSIAIDEATTAGAINEAAQLRKRLEAVEVRGGWRGLLSCFMLSQSLLYLSDFLIDAGWLAGWFIGSFGVCAD